MIRPGHPLYETLLEKFISGLPRAFRHNGMTYRPVHSGDDQNTVWFAVSNDPAPLGTQAIWPISSTN